MTLSSGAESFVVTLGVHHSPLCVGGGEGVGECVVHI